MPRYVPRSGCLKKQEILWRREKELIHALRHESGADVVARASEKVRDAHLGLIKAQLTESDPGSVLYEWRKAELRANLDVMRSDWESISIEEIIEQYRKRI